MPVVTDRPYALTFIGYEFSAKKLRSSCCSSDLPFSSGACSALTVYLLKSYKRKRPRNVPLGHFQCFRIDISVYFDRRLLCMDRIFHVQPYGYKHEVYTVKNKAPRAELFTSALILQ